MLILCPNAITFPIPPKVFGCILFCYVPKQHQYKLDQKAGKCIFVGYLSTQEGYMSFLPGKKVGMFINADTTF